MKQPDFALVSSEGYGLEEPRACWLLRSYKGSHPDGYHLVQIQPPLIGQFYGYGDCDIDKVVLAARHKGHSFIHVVDWPISVHVAIPRSEDVLRQDTIECSDLKLIGWAEVYQTSEDAERDRKARR